MIKLYDSNITDILPGGIEDPAKLEALGHAIKMAMQRLLGYCQNISVYAAIDKLPESIVDMLALDLNTQYYDTSLDIEAKRRLVKNTLVWYMRAGTPAAVEELIQAVFGEGEVKEWFEYGDDPYYFKISTNASLTPEANEQFSEMIRRVKNTRSHIRAIEIIYLLNQELMAGVGQHSNYRPAAIIDGYSEAGHDIDGTVYGGILSYAQTRPEPILEGFSFKGGQVETRICSGTAVAATAKQAAIREGLADAAGTVTVTIHSGAARGFMAQRPAAITEGLAETAEPVTQAIAAGVAADNSRYKNIITE